MRRLAEENLRMVIVDDVDRVLQLPSRYVTLHEQRNSSGTKEEGTNVRAARWRC